MKPKRRQAARRVRTAALYDWVGSCGREPAEEAADALRHMGVMIDGLKFEPAVLVRRVADIPVGTDLMLFDFGGVMGGYGHNALLDESRPIVQWAEDHPSSVVIIDSEFTWRYLEREAEDLGLTRPINMLPWHGSTNEEHDRALRLIAGAFGGRFVEVPPKQQPKRKAAR